MWSKLSATESAPSPLNVSCCADLPDAEVTLLLKGRSMTLLGRLGRSVFLVAHSSERFAAKICRITNSIGKLPLQTPQAQLEREASLLTGVLSGCRGVPSASLLRTESHLILLLQPVGCSLDGVKPPPSELDERLEYWAHELAGILNDVHRRGVMHRDIRPENIMIADDDQLILLDFGLAGLVGDVVEQSLIVAGTPAYASSNYDLGVPMSPWDDVEAAGFTLHALRIGISQWVDLVRAGRKPSFAALCRQDPVVGLLPSLVLVRPRTTSPFLLYRSVPFIGAVLCVLVLLILYALRNILLV